MPGREGGPGGEGAVVKTVSFQGQSYFELNTGESRQTTNCDPLSSSPCRRKLKLKPLPRTAPGFPAGTVRENARLTDSLEQHTSLKAAGHGLHPALAPYGGPESSGDGGQLEHSIRAPTYEEVKEFCLLSGGGYGETDPSTGKFCLGAYSELLHEQGAGKSIESSAHERELLNDSHRGCMGGWCQSKSKKSQVSPTQPTPVKQMSSGKLKSEASVFDRIKVPTEGFEQGVLPRSPFIQKEPAPRQLGRDGPCPGYHRVGSFIFNLAMKSDAVSGRDVTLEIKVKPPDGGVAPYAGTCLYVGKDVDAPVYCVWAGPGGDSMPSTTSELVGRVATPQPNLGASDHANFPPWMWQQAKTESLDEGQTCTLSEIPVRPGGACAIQVPLLLRSEASLEKSSCDERVAALGRMHAWALLHTISISVPDGQHGGAEFGGELYKCLRPSADKQNVGSASSGDVEISGLGGLGQPYFEERVIDRDMAFLQSLDGGLDDKMTVATGRLHWRSRWRRERALYVTVPTSMATSAHKDPRQLQDSLKQQAAGETPDPWWKKQFGDAGFSETGMYSTSPWLLRFLFEHVWNVPRPALVLTITGGAKDFQLPVGQKDKIMRGLMDVAKTMRAWVVTGGSNAGIMKMVGQACAEQNNDIPLIGILPWGVVEGRHLLLAPPSDFRVKPVADTFATDYEKCTESWGELVAELGEEDRSLHVVARGSRTGSLTQLNEDHTHFILVKDGQSENYSSEIQLRTGFEACVSDHESYVRDILGKLKEQKLGWQGMNIEQVKARQDRREAEARRQQRLGLTNLDVIPGVCVCVEGGPGTVQTVWSTSTRGTPVVVVKNTGRAADLLADVTDIFDPGIERYTERMEQLHDVYAMLKSDGSVDNSMIRKVLTEYGLFEEEKSDGENRKMLERSRDAVFTGRCYIFDCDDETTDNNDLDGAILQSILWGWGDAAAERSPRPLR